MVPRMVSGRALAAMVVSALALLLTAATAHGELYWADLDTNTIGRANLDGSGANASFIAPSRTLGGGVAVDADHVYWASWSGYIGRADRDGTDVDESFIETRSSVSFVAVDDEYVYWTTDNDWDGAIGRARIDGTEVDDTFITGAEEPEGIAVTDTHVYWADWYGGTIGRAALDGTEVDHDFIPDAGDARGLAVSDTHVYWADSTSDGFVARANLDGTGLRADLFQDDYPIGVATVGDLVYWDTPQWQAIALGRTSGAAVNWELVGSPFPAGLAVRSAWPQLPGPVSFGNVLVGASDSRTVPVSNSGDDPLVISSVSLTGSQYAITANTCTGSTIPPGGSCGVTVRLAPTSVGSKSGTLQINSNVPSSLVPNTISLNGRGVAPTIATSPTGIAFGTQRVGTSTTPQTVTVTNSATGMNAGPLVIADGGVTVTGAAAGDYAIDSDECSGQTLAPSGSCTVEVVFAPTTTGSRAATLSIASNASGSPTGVALSGTGGEPGFEAAPDPFDFGRVNVDTTGDVQRFVVGNPGSLPLTIPDVTLAGAGADQFAIDADTCAAATLQPDETCAVDVAFLPTSVGAKTAELRFDDDAPGAPHTVVLTGHGTQAQLSATPAGLDFGTLNVGAVSAPRTVTVANSASGPDAGPLAIADVALTGPQASAFTIDDDTCAGTVLDPGDACAATLAFAPTGAGPASAALTVDDDAPGGPHTVALTGTATVPAPPTPPVRPDVPDGGGGGGGGGTASAPSRDPSPITPGPSAAGPAAPAVQVLLRRRAIAVDHRGRARLALRCAAPAGSRCRAALQLRARAGTPRSRAISRRARTTRAAGRRWTKGLRLTPSMRRVLARSCRSVAATLRTSVLQPDGSTAVADVPVRLRRASCRRR
ncbi:MAG TPA: choice-of-anchor D domain-containing protein [Capillimicrobium sp.]|nr:choice-of-anchor D domain-containing protein [Capillimicrobium sp.]